MRILCFFVLVLLLGGGLYSCEPVKSSVSVSTPSLQTSSSELSYVDSLSYYRSLRLSMMLDVEFNYVFKNKLYHFVSDWLSVPYGSTQRDGIDDCKLTQMLYKSTYDVEVPGNFDGLVAMSGVSFYTGQEYLSEGDMIFFNYNAEDGSMVKVVGVYLVNRNFLVNCEKTGRVSIESIDDDFWKDKFKFAGRLL